MFREQMYKFVFDFSLGKNRIETKNEGVREEAIVKQSQVGRIEHYVLVVVSK